MKRQKIIYLAAFLLSLSLILLLEVSSLGLLAEDIKPKEKKEVEIELLLSTSQSLADGNTQTKEIKKDSRQNKSAEKSKPKVDKKSSEANKEKIIENKEVKKINEVKKEEEKAKQNNEVPAWMKQKQKTKTEIKQKSKSDKFDLDKFLAKIEKENDSNLKNEAQNKNNYKNDSASVVNEKQSSEPEVSENNNPKNQLSSSIKTKENNSSVDTEKKVYDLRKGNSSNIKKPGIKNYVQPLYPDNLRKRDIEGKVIVSLRINKKGEIYDFKINQSSGYTSFDQAALKAVQKWSFEAAEKNDKKVEVIVNLPIKFKLN